jgi:hypothetical protein
METKRITALQPHGAVRVPDREGTRGQKGRQQVMHVDTAGSVLADVPVRNSCRNARFRNKPMNDYLNCMMPH